MSLVDLRVLYPKVYKQAIKIGIREEKRRAKAEQLVKKYPHLREQYEKAFDWK